MSNTDIDRTTVGAIVHNANTHSVSAYGKSDLQFLRMLLEEVGELAEALDGAHEHPAEVELVQIAGIALNWLRLRGGYDFSHHKAITQDE
jgi:hypothetical protein